MKIALLADLHFGVKKSDQIFQQSQLRFFKEQFVNDLKEKNIDTIVVCGDVFDTRQSVNVQTENVVLDLFKETFKDFNVHIIIGNHDMFHTDTTEINSLKALNLLPNVTVYETPTDVMLGNEKVLMLPWITDYDSFDSLILDHYKYAFAHLDIIGFDMGGKMADHGVTIKSVISKADHMFTGHYHNRSHHQYREGQTITYVGSPYQITRMDKFQERGYLVLDLETSDIEWCSNNKSMTFQVFTYPNIDKTKITGNVVDIHIPWDLQNETKKIYDLVSSLDLMGPAYPVNTFNDPKPESEDEEVQLETSSFNLLSLFKTYIEQIETTLDKNELYDKLVELYNQFKGNES